MKQFGVFETPLEGVRYAPPQPKFEDDECRCRPLYKPTKFNVIVKEDDDVTWRTHSGPFQEDLAHEICDALMTVAALDSTNEALKVSGPPA